jgi:hypothetical protein
VQDDLQSRTKLDFDILRSHVFPGTVSITCHFNRNSKVIRNVNVFNLQIITDKDELRRTTQFNKDYFTIIFKHPVAFVCTSYTLYSVLNATVHLQLRILLFYFATCFGHNGPSSGVLFVKTVAL